MYTNTKDRYFHEFTAQQKNILNEAKITLSETISTANRDLEFLVNSDYLKRLLLTDYAAIRNLNKKAQLSRSTLLIEDFFKNVMSSRRGIYAQIRLIDTSGHEIVRVDNIGENTKVVSIKNLQDKSQRYYFKDALKLTKGQLYISHLDLNMESGEVEKPLNPMIRFIMATNDLFNQPKGFLVVNISANKIIKRLKDIATTRDQFFWLVNSDGNWLVGPNPQHNWEYMLSDNPQDKFSRTYPSLWEEMTHKTNPESFASYFNTELLSVMHFNPASEVLDNHNKVISPPNEVWYLVAAKTREQIDQITRNIEEKYTIPFFAIAFIFALLSLGIATINDSRKRALESYRKAKEVAESASLAKSDFLSKMSHEIRTPMNAILGLAYLLDKKISQQEAQETGRKILRAGQSLQNILNDILDFSKIEAGKLELTHEPFRLKDVLDNISTIMSTYAHNENIELIIRSDLPQNQAFVGDSLHLEQILINLLSNAIKFTEKGHVALRVNTHGDCVRFSVEDTGIGMDQSVIDRIFNPFEQGDTSITRHYGGTGLGLSICSRLLERMESTLRVKSELGKGTTFYFDLRLDTIQTDEDLMHALRDISVLIADDHEVALEALALSAKSLSWKTTTVRDGLQAVDAASGTDKIDLFLLDWKMPNLDGLSAARLIKSTLPNPPIIVMVTAYAHEGLLKDPNSKYVDAVLEKPVTPSSLYNVVTNTIGKKQSGQKTLTLKQSHNLEGVRILVVDDNEFNRDVANRIFTSEGGYVITAENGQKAVDWLESHPDAIDVVLMDIQMPVMDGYEATQVIRSNEKLNDLKIIALTAGAFDRQRQKALDAGMDDFIAKPFDVSKAIETILRVLSTSLASEETVDHASPLKDSEDIAEIINYERAMSFWGDQNTLERYLQKFLDDYKDVYEELKQSSGKETGHIAHKLRGAAASLSLNRMADYSGAIEEATETGKDIAPLLEQVRICHEETRAAINTVLAKRKENQNASSLSSPEAPKEHTGSDLERLSMAIESDDPNKVRPILKELSQILPSDFITSIQDAIDDYDFEEAANRLKHYMNNNC